MLDEHVIDIVKRTIEDLEAMRFMALKNDAAENLRGERVLREINGRVGGANGAAARMAINRTTFIARMKKLGVRQPLVKGKHVTGFTNGEEEEVELTHVVPFLVEDELLRLGAIFEKKANWQPFAITDGRLITGQNPASSTVGAQALLKAMAAEEVAVYNSAPSP